MIGAASDLCNTYFVIIAIVSASQPQINPPLPVEYVPRQAGCRVRELGFVQAVNTRRTDRRVRIQITAHGQVHLHGATDRRGRESFIWHLSLGPRPVGIGIGNRLRCRSEFTEALLDHRDAKLVVQALRALVFPPIETLEDARLVPFSRIVLVHQELRLMKFPLDRQRTADILRLPQVIWPDRLDSVRTQILGNLPIPHRQRAELGRDQQDGQADGLERRHAPIGFTQHLREDHGFGSGDFVPERHRLEKLNMLA